MDVVTLDVVSHQTAQRRAGYVEQRVQTYRVGYRDASHFNREYTSPFGAPPMRDVQRL